MQLRRACFGEMEMEIVEKENFGKRKLWKIEIVENRNCGKQNWGKLKLWKMEIGKKEIVENENQRKSKVWKMENYGN